MYGSKQVVTKDIKDPGYELAFGICLRCGEEVAKSDNYECPKCHSKDIRDWKQTTKTISQNQVREIVNREVAYECPVCHRKYPTPTRCCFLEFDSKRAMPRVSLDGKWVKTWYCSGCNSRYFQPMKDGECCEDQPMFKGRMLLSDLPEDLRKEVIGRNSPVVIAT